MSKRFSGAKLLTLRKARGISRSALAVAVGREADAVGTWERGAHPPQLDAFLALMEVLDCDAADLLTDDDPARVGDEQGRRTAVSQGTSTGSRVERDRRVES